MSTLKYWESLNEFTKSVAGPTIMRPELGVQDLDALLWFTDTFDYQSDCIDECEISNLFHEQLGHPFRYLPRQVLADMDSAHDYIRKLIYYALGEGNLSMKLDFTIEQLSYDKPVFYSLADYGRWRESRKRRPSLTRKRANGLWWILTLADEMESLSEEFGTGHIYSLLEYPEGEESWNHGKRILSGLARWNESRFPTAPRNVS